MWPILDADLPNTAGKHKTDFLEAPSNCTLLALFPKRTVMLCHYGNTWLLVLKCIDNYGGKNPTLINYPDKLLCFFCLFSFPLVNRRRERPRTSWDLWRQVDVTSSKPAIKRGSLESCWRGEYPSEQEGQRVREQMIESVVTWSTTINKHKTQIWSVYSKTTLLTLHKTTKQQGLLSHGTDFSQNTEKGKSKYTPTQR